MALSGGDGPAAGIDEVLITRELARRPSRPPDHAAECRAMSALAGELAGDPRRVMQKLSELVRELCDADSAGVAVLNPDDGEYMDWHAAAGAFGQRIGEAMPREDTPCGMVLERDEIMLFSKPERWFPAPREAGMPECHEVLITPWTVDGNPVGTVCAVTHRPDRHFDAEDARILGDLAEFASAAWQAVAARERVERQVEERTRELVRVNERLTREAEQRSLAERELRESHAVLDAVMDTEAVGLLFFSLDGRVVNCNRALERMSGYTLDELRTSTHWLELSSPDFMEATRRAVAELRSDGRTAPYMKEMQRKDGGSWWGLFAPSCLSTSDGPRSCLAFVIDITASRNQEAALRESEERFRALVKGFAQAVWETDAAGQVVADSPSWREFTGQSVEQWLGEGWLDAVHPDERDYVRHEWLAAVAGGYPVNAEFRVRTAAGAWRWTNARAAPLRNRDGEIVRWVGMSIDVDERRHIQEALRESEGRFRALADASPALIFQFDAQGNIGYANRRCVEVLGIDEVGMTREAWAALLHPDDARPHLDRVRTAIEARAPYQQRIRVRAVDGHWRWLDTHGAPLFTADGEYRGHVGISVDITEAVQAEEALKEADRRKDEFLATLAHELRNPLAPISNAVHLLRRPDGRRTADRMVEMVGRQVRQIVRLVDDLMEVSRITRGKLELRASPVSLTDILNTAIETSMPGIEAGRHQLTVSMPEESLMLRADKVRLTQVFSNLLNNAAKYTDRGGQIWLAVRNEGGEVAVSVRDNGVGIQADQLPHVFEMFAQAHRDSARGQSGLGIGLTMVRSLVEMHGGRVEARSEGPGQGSEFVVWLPLLREGEGAAPLAAGDDQEEAALDGQRILVVDDNVDAAESLSMMLADAGAEVRVAADGAGALEMVREFRPETILLDLGMPGMDGFEVARRVRQLTEAVRPRIVALTGWGQEADRRRTSEAGFDNHLTKPVDIEALVAYLVRGREPEWVRGHDMHAP